MTAQPDCVKPALDADMRWLFENAGDWPEDVRLYGGTAVALYFGHRASRDLDFVHVSWGVTEQFVRAEMGVFGVGAIEGGPGMQGHLDLACPGPTRVVRINYMETDPSLILPPVHDPVTGPGGVAVAHIEDLLACKLRALAHRDAGSDYQDVAEAIRQAPEAVFGAIRILDGAKDDIYHLLRVMAAPGPSALSVCPEADLKLVSDFAVGYLLHDPIARPTEPLPTDSLAEAGPA